MKLEAQLPFLGALLKKEQDLEAFAEAAGGERFRSSAGASAYPSGRIAPPNPLYQSHFRLTTHVVSATDGLACPTGAGSRPRALGRVPRRKAVDVFEYLDYRALLSTYYEAEKREGRGFSYRAFSRRAGLRSPDHSSAWSTASVASRTRWRFDTRARWVRRRRGRVPLQSGPLQPGQDERRAQLRVRAADRLPGLPARSQARAAHAAYHAQWFVPVVRESPRARTSARPRGSRRA